jgi:hypothetical protein
MSVLTLVQNSVTGRDFPDPVGGTTDLHSGSHRFKYQPKTGHPEVVVLFRGLCVKCLDIATN